MNKYIKVIALAMIICAINVSNAAIIINTGSDACKSSADTGKDCTCRYNSGIPGKCVAESHADEAERYRCQCEPGSILGEAPSNTPEKSVTHDRKAWKVHFIALLKKLIDEIA